MRRLACFVVGHVPRRVVQHNALGWPYTFVLCRRCGCECGERT